MDETGTNTENPHKCHRDRVSFMKQPDWRECKYLDHKKLDAIDKYKIFGETHSILKGETMLIHVWNYTTEHYRNNKEGELYDGSPLKGRGLNIPINMWIVCSRK